MNLLSCSAQLVWWSGGGTCRRKVQQTQVEQVEILFIIISHNTEVESREPINVNVFLECTGTY